MDFYPYRMDVYTHFQQTFMFKQLVKWTLHPMTPLSYRDTYSIVIWVVDVSGHPKVSNFHEQAVTHEAVAGGQVTVHKMLGGQVDHACRYLCSDMKHLRETKFPVRLHRLAIHEDHGVRTMGSETWRETHVGYTC